MVYGGLLVLLLLTAINYQNSLIYVLTFLLGMLFFLSIMQTYRTLAGVRLTLVSAGEGFAGSATEAILRLHPTEGMDHPGIRIKAPMLTHPLSLGLVRGEMEDCRIPVELPVRGAVALPRIKIESRFPFGLLRAWSWFRPSSEALAWPRPIAPPPGVDSGLEGHNESDTRREPGEQWLELRPYRHGDLLQRVQWKRFARTGEMVSAQWHSGLEDPDWLDYARFPGHAREQRLSFLAYLVETRHRQARPFGLRLPGIEIKPATGRSHRLQCLRALARWA